MNDDVEIKIKLLDQYGKPIDDLQKKTAGFGKVAQKVNGDINKSLNDLRIQLARYKQASESSYRIDHIEKYKDLIAETQKQISELEKQTKTCADKTNAFSSTLTKAGLITAGFSIGKAALSWGKEFGKESVQADVQMQNYNATLKTMLGSTGAARDRMAEYLDIAKITPFDMPQVVEAGNRLQAIGKYSRENVELLGDLAAASGKGMEESINAYTALATGQKGAAMKMFRNLLITTEDWTAATGKGVNKSGELLATTKEMIAVLPKIMKSKGYLGMMAEQAATTGGKMANLEDAVFGLKAAIGEQLRPATNAYLKTANGIVEKLTNWVEIPLPQKIAQEKSEVNHLMQSLIDEFPHEEKRQKLIDELNRKYPELLKNIDLEKTSTEELKNRLVEVNQEYNKKMRQAAINRIREKMGNELIDAEATILVYEEAERGRNDAQKIRQKVQNIYGKGSYIVNNDAIYAKNADGSIVRIGDDNPDAAVIISEYTNAIETSEGWMGEWTSYKSALKNRKKYQDKIKAFNKQFGEEPPPATDPTKGGGKNLTDDLEDAATTISAGGKTVKNFNIVINGGLVNGVTNQFNSSQDNPASADDFMDKLARALMMILNDVNYAA